MTLWPRGVKPTPVENCLNSRNEHECQIPVKTQRTAKSYLVTRTTQLKRENPFVTENTLKFENMNFEMWFQFVGWANYPSLLYGVQFKIGLVRHPRIFPAWLLRGLLRILQVNIYGKRLTEKTERTVELGVSQNPEETLSIVRKRSWPMVWRSGFGCLINAFEYIVCDAPWITTHSEER